LRTVARGALDAGERGEQEDSEELVVEGCVTDLELSYLREPDAFLAFSSTAFA